jgi:outer membrane receptor protein involved in Fe transport
MLGSSPPAGASTIPARTPAARVLDSKSGEPISDAVVVSGSIAVVTDSEGRFVLPAVHDTSLVAVQRIGYRPAVFRAAGLPAEIRLHRAPVVLTSLHVTASAAPVNRLGQLSLLSLASAPRNIFAERAAPATAEGLETMEGASTSRPGSWGAKAYLRGLGGERVVVLLDGNRIHRACNVGMDAGLATVNPDNVERVELLSGPGSTLYGSGNLGGVINVVTRGSRGEEPLQGEIRMAASSGVPGGRLGGTIWGRRDRFAFTGAVDGTSYGDQRSPRGVVSSSSFRDATVDVTGSYGVDRPHRLDGRVQRYAGRDIGFPGSGEARIPEEDRLLLALDYGGQVSRGVLDGVNAKAFRQSVDHHMTMAMTMPPAMPGGTPTRSETDARSRTDIWGGRVQARLRPSSTLHLDAGLEATRWDAEGSRWVERTMMGAMVRTEYRSWPGVRITDAGGFAQGAWSITPRLEGGAGFRLDGVLRRADGFARTSEWVPSGNLGLRASTADGKFARAGLGFGYRVPDPTELYGLLPRPDGYVYTGNPDLATEKSRNVELSAGWDRRSARASVTLYRNRIADFISTAATGDSLAGLPVRQYRNVADARVDGVSAALSAEAWHWLGLRGTVGYSRGENRGNGVPLPLIPPWEGSVAARVSLPGWPWIEPEVLAAARQTRAATAQGEVRTPGFLVLHVRAGRSFHRTGVVLGVENLLDRAYRRHLDPTRVLRPGRNVFLKVTQGL